MHMYVYGQECDKVNIFNRAASVNLLTLTSMGMSWSGGGEGIPGRENHRCKSLSEE